MHRDGSAAALALGALLGWLALPALPAPAAEPASADDETRATMREIFENIRVVLPLTASEERFAAPENRATVETALGALAEHADELAAHAPGQDPTRRALGRSLAHDAAEARMRYQAGRFESAAFQIQQATEYCIACHTRLPSPGDSPLAEHFVDESALASLPLPERARLQVATRQFDDAVASYQRLLGDPAIAPNELLTPLADYLVVEVRVQREFERPRKTLARFARRADLWRHLRLDVEAWMRALRELAPVAKQPPSLATARDLLQRARLVNQYPADRRALVHYLVASSVLQRLLETNPPPRDAAEAFYLLGLAETHIGDTSWVPQTQVYLEAAIRLAPQEPFAYEAYALLEEETLADYTGSAGVSVPDSVAKHLAELRELVDD